VGAGRRRPCSGSVSPDASVVVMPGLGHVKRRLGTEPSSAATARAGTQNYLSAAQAAIVLVALCRHGRLRVGQARR
jgi:hypothetical protein